MSISRCLFVACVLATAVCAQEFRATLQGTVSDASHAAVPGATVLLKNNETGIDRQTTTDSEGHYVFPFVVPGAYIISVRGAGFKTAVRENVSLAVNDNLKLDVDVENA